MPAEEAFQICHDLLEPVENIRNYYENFYFAVEKPLFQNWSNTAPALLIKGSFYVNYAWHARGNTTAAKVTEEGWKLFGERLEIAANALETAWKLDPSDGRIANEMLGVELGQGKGREREELWFKRAMALYTNNYDACHAKLTYLQPKWHGSAEAMLAFGKECVDSEVWGGRVPLILADAHEALAYYVPQAGRADFWKQPQVWRDVKAAYEKFFLLNPDAISWRHNYARYAFWCEAWDDLNKQIPLLGEVNYDYFGGREEYERMVRLGKERGGKTAGR
jgi:hypothetical protein